MIFGLFTVKTEVKGQKKGRQCYNIAAANLFVGLK
jgi:hypothetical protein